MIAEWYAQTGHQRTNYQILVVEVPVVVEVARARGYGLEEVVEALVDVQGFLLVEEKHHQSRILQLTRIAL